MSDVENNQSNYSQEQPKGTPLVPDQVSEWGDLTQFQEPGLSTEQGEEVRTGEEADEEGDDKKNDGQGEQEEYDEPLPSVTVEDPGEYTPKDYSFEVTIYDEEGKNGKPVKVSSVEEYEALLEKDANFGSPSALLKAQRLATKMENNLDRDQTSWQEKRDKFAEQQKVSEERQQQISNIASEIDYLVSKGMLPAVDKKYANADWTDPEVAKQPGVKEQVELLNYMRKENDARTKAKLRPLTSILDAYNAMQLDQRHQQDKENKKKSGEARKAAGARVSGSSPAPVSNVPKGIMVGRGGSLRDIDAGWGV